MRLTAVHADAASETQGYRVQRHKLRLRQGLAGRIYLSAINAAAGSGGIGFRHKNAWDEFTFWKLLPLGPYRAWSSKTCNG